jgi:formamidopyrimidine-DNA glycosylase
VIGRSIAAVEVREPRLRWPVAKTLPSKLAGQRIDALERRGKYLLFGTRAGTLLVHLGMSGSLRYLANPPAHGPHDHVDLVLAGGGCLRFNDPRRFGSLHHGKGAPEAHRLLRNLAPEPLGLQFDTDYLFAVTRKRRVSIKQAIMNGALVVGVGNIYASEALFRAKIRPGRAARSLTRAECMALVRSIRFVLTMAIRHGGTTLRDYVGASGEPGQFRQKLFVYERAGLPCRSCGTKIRQRRQGQRSTYFCPTCQA